MVYSYKTVSHIGKRAKNEDDFFPREHGLNTDLFIVCDGLGGHGDGDLAASFVADHLASELNSMKTLNAEKARKALFKVDANLKRYAQQVGNPKMGTTTAFIKTNRSAALLGWVGDSRVYHLRDGKILFRSSDHSMIELFRQNGQLADEDVDSFPLRHIIWQALGQHHNDLQPALEYVPQVQPGDRFFLATDGLTNSCDDTFLSELLMQDPDAVMTTLTEKCTKTATDNFTFTLITAQ